MTEAFEGTWKLINSDNFDKYMESIGVSFIVRKAVEALKPNVIISRKGDDICLTTESTFKTTNLNFCLGKEFSEKTADGRDAKTIITLDNDVLCQVQKWDGKETSILREVKDDKMIVTCIMNDTKCVRTYERV
uniref:Myelin P2 protein-like n=1 Tax=Geotrypetes seraphini TaxID=260995 RepID=A0A6P8QSZ7_GEOSA|nr:myelin P2 protein-like [Geotrypetes seraphini]